MAKLISREAALKEFQELSGFRAALKALVENPLPTVIVVQPGPQWITDDRAQNLLEKLARRPEVEAAQFDLQWVKRLQAIMAIVERGVLVLALFLSLAVLLIVGNTIRLGILNRREEIEISKLFGATNAFIRRPFLYTGFWYGLLGGVIAWFLVSGSFELLRGPVQGLAELYAGGFTLSGLGFEATLILLGSGALLGLFGSWVAVGRHLGEIEPS